MIVYDAKKVEQCTKVFVKQFQYKPNTELYKMNIDNLKKTIFECAKIDDMMVKTINESKNYDTYIVYDDSKNIEYINLNNNVLGIEKGYNKIKTMKQNLKLSRNKKRN